MPSLSLDYNPCADIPKPEQIPSLWLNSPTTPRFGYHRPPLLPSPRLLRDWRFGEESTTISTSYRWLYPDITKNSWKETSRKQCRTVSSCPQLLPTWGIRFQNTPLSKSACRNVCCATKKSALIEGLYWSGQDRFILDKTWLLETTLD